MNPVAKPTAESLFTASRKLTLFTLIGLPILLSLGTWQLNRAAEKRVLEAAYAEQQAQPPSQLSKENLLTLPDHRRVFVQGHFDGDHTWLLDNKQRRGRVGYEVVAPFYLQEGGQILVNRGWLAGNDRRENLPDIPAVAGTQMLFGEVVSVSTHPLLDGASDRADWPRVIMAIEPAVMAQQLNQPLPERYLRLDDTSPGALVTEWQTVNISSDKHSGYAFQWFGMAFALAVWFVVANTKVLHTWRQSNHHHNNNPDK